MSVPRWYGPDFTGPIWGNASILHIVRGLRLMAIPRDATFMQDLQEPRLQNYVKASGAATLRIGGSQDNIVKYL